VELKDYIENKRKRHELMKEAGEKMNLGPNVHYNPVTGTFIRSTQIDPFRMMFKPSITPVSRPNTFMTSRILANAPILSVSDLLKIKQPSSRAKYLCRQLEQLYKPSSSAEPQRPATSSIQILSVEQKTVTRNPVEEDSSEQDSDEEQLEIKN
jgi:hypothetical protein